MTPGATGSSMDCTTWHEAMSARLDGEASTADDDALDRHLRACADCSALLVDLTALHRRFRLHPAPQVPDLVLAALASAERLDDVSAAGAAPTSPIALHPRQRFVLRIAGAAAVIAIGLTTAALAGAFGGGVRHARVVVDVASARPAATGGSTLVYLRLDNRGASDVVTGASSPVASSAVFHRSAGHSGEAVMRAVTTIAAPGGAEDLFASDNVHVMLEGLNRDLEPGDVVPVTLTFGHSGTVTVQATVSA